MPSSLPKGIITINDINKASGGSITPRGLPGNLSFHDSPFNVHFFHLFGSVSEIGIEGVENCAKSGLADLQAIVISPSNEHGDEDFQALQGIISKHPHLDLFLTLPRYDRGPLGSIADYAEGSKIPHKSFDFFKSFFPNLKGLTHAVKDDEMLYAGRRFFGRYGVRDPKVFVLAGSSGAGKSTLLGMMKGFGVKSLPRITTRPYRSYSEANGDETLSISKGAFGELNRCGLVLVPSEREGHAYGIHKGQFLNALNSDHHHIFTTTNMEAALHLKEAHSDKVQLILLSPVSPERGLERRIEQVGTPSEGFNSMNEEMKAYLRSREERTAKNRMDQIFTEYDSVRRFAPRFNHVIKNDLDHLAIEDVYDCMFQEKHFLMSRTHAYFSYLIFDHCFLHTED